MAREGSPDAKIPCMAPPESRGRPVVTLLALLVLVGVVVGLWAIQPERPPAPPAVRLTPTAVGATPPFSIVRVPARDVVVINVGMGDQVRQGMTFDVYDKYVGLPAAQPAANRQGSKALLELIRIGPGFSQCRVIHQTAGMPLVEGDLVVQAPAGAPPGPAHPAHSGQVPPVPTTEPAPAGTNPGRS